MILYVPNVIAVHIRTPVVEMKWHIISGVSVCRRSVLPPGEGTVGKELCLQQRSTWPSSNWNMMD